MAKHSQAFKLMIVQEYFKGNGGYHQMNAYTNELKEHRIFQSMSRKGNCYDNSVMETFLKY